MMPLDTRKRIPKRSDIIKLSILNFLYHNPKKSAKELSSELGISRQTIHRHLRQLIRKTGLIKITIDYPDRSYRYYCKPGLDDYFSEICLLVDKLGTVFLEGEKE